LNSATFFSFGYLIIFPKRGCFRSYRNSESKPVVTPDKVKKVLKPRSFSIHIYLQANSKTSSWAGPQPGGTLQPPIFKSVFSCLIQQQVAIIFPPPEKVQQKVTIILSPPSYQLVAALSMSNRNSQKTE